MALSGILKINILGLKKTKASSEQVFAVISYDKQATKTKPHQVNANGDSDSWDDSIAFDICHKNIELNISIWSADGSHFFGQLIIAPILVKNAPGGLLTVSQKLTKRKWRLGDKVDGEIEIKLQWEEKVGKMSVEDFTFLKVLGIGGFGKVLQVVKKDSGRVYAMKMIKKQYIVSKREVEHTMTERAVLGRIKHPFIVSLKYSFQDSDRLFLVMDFCNGGELFYHLQKLGCFPEPRAKFYAAEILLALSYLHLNGIIYRDLKPENILLDGEGHVCITDFGLAKEGLGANIEERAKTFCGSIAYMAPEVFEPGPVGYGRGVDFWSYGTLLYEMISGMPPFYNRDQPTMIKLIKSKPLSFNVNFPQVVQDLCMKLLERDPVKRLSDGAMVQSHTWFADIDFNALQQRQVDPPFKPFITSATDIKYFDPEFTNEAPLLSYIETTLSETLDEKFFSGFTYNVDSILADEAKE